MVPLHLGGAWRLFVWKIYFGAISAQLVICDRGPWQLLQPAYKVSVREHKVSHHKYKFPFLDVKIGMAPVYRIDSNTQVTLSVWEIR